MLYKMCTISANQVGIICAADTRNRTCSSTISIMTSYQLSGVVVMGVPYSSWKLQKSVQEKLIVHCGKLKH